MFRFASADEQSRGRYGHYMFENHLHSLIRNQIPVTRTSSTKFRLTADDDRPMPVGRCRWMLCTRYNFVVKSSHIRRLTGIVWVFTFLFIARFWEEEHVFNSWRFWKFLCFSAWMHVPYAEGGHCASKFLCRSLLLVPSHNEDRIGRSRNVCVCARARAC